MAVVWREVLVWATEQTRVRLGGLEVGLAELVPALRLKHSRCPAAMRHARGRGGGGRGTKP